MNTVRSFSRFEEELMIFINFRELLTVGKVSIPIINVGGSAVWDLSFILEGWKVYEGIVAV